MTGLQIFFSRSVNVFNEAASARRSDGLSPPKKSFYKRRNQKSQSMRNEMRHGRIPHRFIAYGYDKMVAVFVLQSEKETKIPF